MEEEHFSDFRGLSIDFYHKLKYMIGFGLEDIYSRWCFLSKLLEKYTKNITSKTDAFKWPQKKQGRGSVGKYGNYFIDYVILDNFGKNNNRSI